MPSFKFGQHLRAHPAFSTFLDEAIKLRVGQHGDVGLRREAIGFLRHWIRVTRTAYPCFYQKRNWHPPVS